MSAITGTDYAGLDNDGDGIGDTPMIVYPSDGYNIYDYYPMIMEITLPPMASFTENVTCNYAPFAVEFTDTSANAPTEWHWEFGDGATSDVQNPVHIYSTPGTYLVNLTVSNDAGSDTVRMADTGKLILALQPLPSPLKAEWLKKYPMSGVTGAYTYNVVDASDDGFAMAGYTTGANSGLRLTKTDSVATRSGTSSIRPMALDWPSACCLRTMAGSRSPVRTRWAC